MSDQKPVEITQAVTPSAFEFKLVVNWREILQRAWSVRLMALAGVLTGAEAALPFVGDLLPVPPGILSAIAAFVTGAAFIARFVAQPATIAAPAVTAPATEGNVQ